MFGGDFGDLVWKSASSQLPPNICIYIHVYVSHLYIYIYIYVRIYMCVHMLVCLHIYVYVYIYICIYIYQGVRGLGATEGDPTPMSRRASCPGRPVRAQGGP